MVDQETELWRAEQAFDRALSQVKQAIPGKPGFGIEAVFGQTYQHLVRLGARPQIKKKYRG